MKQNLSPPDTPTQAAPPDPVPDPRMQPGYITPEQFIRAPLETLTFNILLDDAEEAGRRFDAASEAGQEQDGSELSVLFHEAPNALRNYLLAYGARCFAEGRRRGFAAGLRNEPLDLS